MAVHTSCFPRSLPRVLTAVVLTLLSIVGPVRVEMALLPSAVACLNDQIFALVF